MDKQHIPTDRYDTTIIYFSQCIQFSVFDKEQVVILHYNNIALALLDCGVDISVVNS